MGGASLRSSATLQNGARECIHPSRVYVGTNQRNVVESIANRAHLTSTRLEKKPRKHPSATSCKNIDRSIANHPRASRVEPKRPSKRQEHPRMRFAAGAMLNQRRITSRTALGVMQTDLDRFNADAMFGQTIDNGLVRPSNRITRNLSFGGSRLVGGHGQDESGVLQCSKAIDDARKKSNMARMKRAHDSAKFFITNEVDERPIAVENDAGTMGHEAASATN